MINPKLNKGDRIVLLSMVDEPDMSYGDRGVVTDVSKVFDYVQYNVKWDKGRTLQVLEDTDKWMSEDDFNELINKKKKIKESYTISKKKILKLIIEAQQITVIDFCGRSKQEDYQKWWYNGGQKPAPYTNSYTWNATKKAFVFDFNKDPEFKSLTQTQRDYKLRTKCSGQYTKNPNLITLAAEEISNNASDWLHDFADYFSGGLDLIVPGSGIIVDALNTLVYLIEWYLTTDINRKNDLLLTTAISGLFMFLPGPAQTIAPTIKKFIKTKKVEGYMKDVIKTFLQYIDSMVIDLEGKVTNALKSPLAKTIIGDLTSRKLSFQNLLQSFSTQLKPLLTKLSTN